jgi:hypothetical protein
MDGDGDPVLQFLLTKARVVATESDVERARMQGRLSLSCGHGVYSSSRCRFEMRWMGSSVWWGSVFYSKVQALSATAIPVAGAEGDGLIEHRWYILDLVNC